MMLEHYSQTKCLLVSYDPNPMGFFEMSEAGQSPNTAVTTTRAALEVIDRLEAAHGPLMFFQSGGCCDGSSPMRPKDGERQPASTTCVLGRIGDVPFYIDAEQYERWRRPPLPHRRLAGGG